MHILQLHVSPSYGYLIFHLPIQPTCPFIILHDSKLIVHLAETLRIDRLQLLVPSLYVCYMNKSDLNLSFISYHITRISKIITLSLQLCHDRQNIDSLDFKKNQSACKYKLFVPSDGYRT